MFDDVSREEFLALLVMYSTIKYLPYVLGVIVLILACVDYGKRKLRTRTVVITWMWAISLFAYFLVFKRFV